MKEYQSWTFRDRSFLWALAVSVLWHCFWFFSVTIIVSPPRKLEKNRPKMVSLGPVLNDRIFKTLVENKPQFSQTFYRQPSDLLKSMEVPTKTVERHAPGDVVSLPEGKNFFSSLKDVISGNKSSPDYEFSVKTPAKYSETPFEVEGELKERQLLSLPGQPLPPPGMDPALRNSQTEIEFTVEPSGSVDVAQVVASCGDPSVDLLWVKYLRNWQFAPLAAGNNSDQKGRVHLRFHPEAQIS